MHPILESGDVLRRHASARHAHHKCHGDRTLAWWGFRDVSGCQHRRAHVTHDNDFPYYLIKMIKIFILNFINFTTYIADLAITAFPGSLRVP